MCEARASLRFGVDSEDVAATPHRLDVSGVPWVGLQFLAKPADMVVNRSIKHIRVSSLRYIEQLISAEGDVATELLEPQPWR